MAIIHFARREVEARIVYWGPAYCGKTTNLRSLFHTMPPTQRGDLVTLDTEGERTLLFDYLPITWGSIAGFNGRIRVLGVPGQPLYRDTRRLLLQGADGVVMVVDSHPDRLEMAVESLYELELDLADLGRSLVDMPFVLQYNKRDLPSAMPLETLQQTLNRRGLPSFPAVAIDGTGVHETFEAIATAVSERVGRELTGGMSQATVRGAEEGETPVSDEEEVQSRTEEIRAVRSAEEAAIRAASQPLPMPLDASIHPAPAEPSEPSPGFHVGPAFDPALAFRSGQEPGPPVDGEGSQETPIEAEPAGVPSEGSLPDLSPDGLLSEDPGPTGWTLPPSAASALDTAWDRLEASLHTAAAVRQPLPPVTDDLRDILDAPITSDKAEGQWETPGEDGEAPKAWARAAAEDSGSLPGIPDVAPPRQPVRPTPPQERPQRAVRTRPVRPSQGGGPPPAEAISAGMDPVPREPGAMVSLPFLPRSLQGRRVVRILGSQVTMEGHATVDLLLAPWVPGPPRRVRVRLMAVPREPVQREAEPMSVGYVAFLLLLGLLVGLVIGWRFLA
ncbi:MAG: hypothetical protein JXB39_02170 [Deltaproteobacteria bacterium]|nr:hypothetical protein [Deltaproteobacteria bacterium]